MPPKRLIITGASGKAGTHILPHLLAHDYQILNLDLRPLPAPLNTQVHTLITDLTDPGSVFNALTTHFPPSEPLPPHLPPPPDAVVHLAGLSTPQQVPDNETFRVNVLACHNILEAACKLGVRKIIIASSITVYGVTFHHGPREFAYFPVDEHHPTLPTDVYALSKVCCERAAESFALRYAAQDIDVYALRIGRVTAPDEYNTAMFRSYVREPLKWAVHGWSYIDTRDLAEIVRLCIERPRGASSSSSSSSSSADQQQQAQAPHSNYTVLNVVNDTATHYERTEDVLRRAMPGVPFVREMGAREAPVSNRRCRDVLGWRERHDWRAYYRQTDTAETTEEKKE